jgi:thiol peroxidase
MAQITLRGNPINTVGDLPAVGSPAPGFSLTGTDLGTVGDDKFRGKPLLLNIFPSIDTPVCAASVRTFNERAAASGGAVLCVSKDLPFAQQRFCGAEGIENVTSASAFRDGFGDDYGVTITDGPMAGLLARAVVVVGADGNVTYTELVPEIGQEPEGTRPGTSPTSSGR